MGSRSKEATVVLVDVGPTMRAPLRERAVRAGDRAASTKPDPRSAPTTRFDAAIASVGGVLQQKLFFKPKDEVGVVLFGTEGTANDLSEDGQYEHVTVLSPIDTPSLGVYEALRKLAPAREGTATSDLLDALIVALDLIHRRTDGKKYEKKLLVITDAASRISDASDVEPVVEMIQKMDVKLQIVGIDFRHTTDRDDPADEDEDAVKAEPVAHWTAPAPPGVHVKRENEKMLVSIAKEVQGDVSSASKRMQLLAQGMKKSVGQTTKFRGPLEIGADFGIPVFCYLKTKTATLPSLVKESQASHEKEASGKVRLDRRYTSPQNPDEEVAPDQQVKAYRYGMERVPFSSADVEFFKLQTEKSLKLLGFVDMAQIHWSKFIGGTDVFVAEPGKPNAAQALAALIEAMLDSGHVAVARFVARKNAAPKIIALIPHRPAPGDAYYALWGQQLPFEEDLRAYEFAPLKTKTHTPTVAQQALADKLVESLSVKDDKAQDVGACFNPVLRRFFHAVEQRAFDATAPIPPIPAYVESCLKMDEARQRRIEDIIQGFGDAFQLKEAVKKHGERKKKSFWSDIATTDVKMEDAGGAGRDENDDDGGGAEDDAGSEIDLDELLDGGDVTGVGSMNPIADFETLVGVGKTNRQKLRTAVDGMQAQIIKFFDGRDAAFFPKAVQCLAHFRKRSVELHYGSEFNDFMAELKAKIGGDGGGESAAWKALRNEELTLLTNQDDPTIATTPAQAKTFLFGDEMEVDAQAASASLSSQIEAIENEDEMFADFE